MNLKKATTLLMAGLIYILLHKLLLGVVPSLQFNPMAKTGMTLLWILSTGTLPVFALFLLRKLPTAQRLLRGSLWVMIVCTGIAILERVPFVLPRLLPPVGRLAGEVVRFANGMAMLVFVLALRKLIPPGDDLQRPLRFMLWGTGAGVLLGLVSLGFYGTFLLTGTAPEWSVRLQPLAIAVFVLTYGSAIWFLGLFRKVDNHSALLSTPSAERKGGADAST